MQAGENFSEIGKRAPRAPLRCSFTITDAGLTLGRGTVLAPPAGYASSRLAIEDEEARILALLSTSINKNVPARVIGKLRRPSERWALGEKCLAHIHLAFAGLPKIDDEGAIRLALAEEALAKGASPRAVLKALGLDSACLDALKFDPDQTRVPAGNGRESGRWTTGHGGSEAENASDTDGPLQTGRSVSAGGGRREDESERALEEEKHLLGEETEEKEIEHGRPIDPLEVPTVPLTGPPPSSTLIGNNARPSGSKLNTDLVGGLDEAKSLFESLTEGQGTKTFITPDGVTITQADDGTLLRIMPDGSVRIERPVDIDGLRREVIHFNAE